MRFSDILLERGMKVRSVDLTQCPIEAIIASLKFLYFLALPTERLLKEAGQETDALTDPYTVQLHDYYVRHLVEESGEIDLLISDLASVDVDARALQPNFGAIAMIGTQYYLMKHIDPICLLGYMAVAEACPVSLELVEKLEELHGKDLFKFLRLHAVADLEHRKELIDLIDACPEEKQHLILWSSEVTLKYLAMYGK